MSRSSGHDATPFIRTSPARALESERPCAAPVPEPSTLGFEGWPGTLRRVVRRAARRGFEAR